MALLGLFGIGLFLAVVAGSVLGLVNAGLPSRVRELKEEIRSLRARIEALESPLGHAAEERQPVPGEAPKPEPAASAEHAGAAAKKKRAGRAAFTLALFRRAEGRFASYWTGILGVLALVAGFSFLAVLTALRLGEFPRFLMLCGVSLLFYLLSLAVRRRKGGELFAAWFCSASGALILFACIGSSVIPWLRWVQSEPQGYALLAAGLAVNLWFALKGPYQLFTSFHTLISLTALAVAPPEISVLAAAALVTALCTLPGRKRPWSLHLLASETAFFAFVVAWNLRQPLPGTAAEAAALAALLMGLLPVLLGPYLDRRRDSAALGLTARGAAWLFLMAGTLAVGRSLPGISLIYTVLALAAYLPGRFAAPRGSAVRRLDTSAGLLLAVLAAIGLVRLELDLFSAVAAAALIAFLAAADLKRDSFSAVLSLSLAAAFSLILAAVSLFTLLPRAALPLFGPLPLPAGLVLTGILALAALMELQFLFRNDALLRKLLSLSFLFCTAGLLAAFLSSEAVPYWLGYSGAGVLPFAALAVLIGRRRPAPWLSPSVLMLTLAAHAAALAGNAEIGSLTLSGRALAALLLLAFALVLTAAAGKGADRLTKRPVPVLPGVLLAAADSGLLIAVLTESRDPWLGLTVWALFAAGIYLLRSLLKKRPGDLLRSLTIAGAGTALAAALISVPLLLAGEAAESLSLRLLLYMSVTGALLLWGRRRGGGRRAARPWMLTAAALFAVIAAGGEAGWEYTGPVVTVVALLLFAAGRRGPAFMRAFCPLSGPVFWLGLILLPLASLFSGSLRIEVFSADWWRALSSGVLALGYIGLSYADRPYWTLLVEEEGILPGRLKRFIGEHMHRALFLPFFMSVGLFFVLSARGPVLTSLLILESFTIFSLGILLKEESFRPFAYGLLLVSLGRLILFDMAESDTLERALVFIIAGAVLLGMNWMYNRFRR
jgi:ABC-type multidrug transport system fused ATPase/permease subunit